MIWEDVKLLCFIRKPEINIFELMAVFRAKAKAFMSPKPSFCRKLIYVLSCLFLGIIFLNIFFPRTKFIIARSQIDHEALGNIFLENNNFALASLEFSTADNEHTAENMARVNHLVSQPGIIKEDLIFWTNLTSDFPSYRDAYIKLAILNKKLYRDEVAEKFISSAQKIDPNYELLKKLSLH